MSQALAELLLKDRVISAQHYQEAEKSAKSGGNFVRFLIDKKYVSETKLLYYLSKRFGIPTINLAKFEVKPELLEKVPVELAKRNQVIPIQENEGTIVVAVCDPSNLQAIENIKFQLKRNVETVLTSFSAFDAAMSKYYGGRAFAGAAIANYQKATGQNKNNASLELVEVHELDSQDMEQDAPVITFVNGILSEAIRLGASDIHVEPYEALFRVRLRIDGTLVEMTQAPLNMKRAVAARLKIMSRMDIAETRVPQDGRIKLKMGGRPVDFRVNTLPTLFGEKVVLRLLNQGAVSLDIHKLGFDAQQLEIFKKGIYQPNGIVLVTGPTGSGKTTTLYSGLQELNKISENISTVEDPVEYNLEGINQVQVNSDIDFTFANVLRSLLRQDPDVILVGEIRDQETAEVAFQAALTGHLVLSTLHTNDAPSTLTRLLNMDVEPFLVAAAVKAVTAQRLLRTICPKCREEQKIPPEKLIQLGFRGEQLGKIRSFYGKGCASCNQTGYSGRVAIHEVMDFNQDLTEMVLARKNSSEIKKAAIRSGMKTLRMSALSRFAEGMVSLEEALAKTSEN